MCEQLLTNPNIEDYTFELEPETKPKEDGLR
jgi:phosphoribosylformylglycinamidine (FGAM) synthase PurS component